VDAGLSCYECRKTYDEASDQPPCSKEILPDGTCQFGMPEVARENVFAVQVFSDINLMGFEAAMALNARELTDWERGDLVMKLRVLFAEGREIEREKIEASKNKSGR
jgi:hypothetical protein